MVQFAQNMPILKIQASIFKKEVAPASSEHKICNGAFIYLFVY